MINANELRIGNYVKLKGVSKPIKVFVIDTTETSTMTKAEPIPLTEEILLKCGFNKFIDETQVFDSIYRLGIIDIAYHSRHKKFHFHNVVINSVHQLQNLYFALTKTELKVNL